MKSKLFIRVYRNRIGGEKFYIVERELNKECSKEYVWKHRIKTWFKKRWVFRYWKIEERTITNNNGYWEIKPIPIERDFIGNSDFYDNLNSAMRDFGIIKKYILEDRRRIEQLKEDESARTYRFSEDIKP